MPSFSPTDAAIEGFRLTRERPVAVVAWAVLYLVVGLASAGLAGLVVGPGLDALKAASLDKTMNPAQAAAKVRELAPYVAITLPFTVVLQSTLVCAVYRAALKPEQSKAGYLRFGLDEGRMVVLSLMLILIAFAALFAAMFVNIFAAQVLPHALGDAGLALAALVSVASLVGLVVLAVRLSLAAPMTFVTRKVSLFRSWPLTRGQFWPLLGAYVLADGLAVLVFVLANIVFWAVTSAIMLMSGVSQANVQRAFSASGGSASAFVAPAMIGYQLFIALLMMVVYAIIQAPPAIAYAALTSRGAKVDVKA